MAELHKKPQNGSLMSENNCWSIVWNNKKQPFGLDFIIKEIKTGIKGSRQGLYTERLRELSKELACYGIFAIPRVSKSLDSLACGSDINRNFLKQIKSWLNYIKMFSNMGKKRPVKSAYRENFDNIFRKA